MLEAFLEDLVKRSTVKTWDQKFLQSSIKRRTWISPTHQRAHPYAPDVRQWVLDVWPSSGEGRIRDYVRRAVEHDLVRAFWRGPPPERFEGIPSVDQVPSLVYISSVPASVSEFP